ETDRMDPVDPAARLELSPATLQRFPEGYRHLAYLQVGLGYDVKPDMPGLAGPEVDALYQRGSRWLAGGPCDRHRRAGRRWTGAAGQRLVDELPQLRADPVGAGREQLGDD